MDPRDRDRDFPSARIFCSEALLHLLQLSPHRPFKDSKTLVDLRLRLPPSELLARAAALPSHPTRSDYLAFLGLAFHLPVTPALNAASPQDDAFDAVVTHTPTDYTDEAPRFTQRPQHISVTLSPTPDPDTRLRAHVVTFAQDLKRRWPKLCRITSRDTARLAQTSAIALPHPFFVPGGRFAESYYWDSLFVVHGLLASDMVQSALDVARNLLHLVDTFGFVPNAARVYYLSRSQPPVLADIVAAIAAALPHDHTPLSARKRWIAEALPRLETELRWFETRRAVRVLHPRSQLADTPLTQYFCDAAHARPESFREDEQTVRNHVHPATDAAAGDDCPATTTATSTRAKEMMYRSLGAGAESGWDFSSRWSPPPRSRGLHDMRVTHIVPVCLNALLLRAERIAARLHATLANHAAARGWRLKARGRAAAMRTHMWDAGRGAWFDVELDEDGLARRTEVVSAAGLFPPRAEEWAFEASGMGGEGDDGVEEEEEEEEEEEAWGEREASSWMHFLEQSSGLLAGGGLYTTSETEATRSSGEQWDWPNTWAPIVQLGVESLRAVGKRFAAHECGVDAARVAATVGGRFVATCLAGWRGGGGVMHEKYDARFVDGRLGGGGEYAPQTGFGWTNGAVLWLLRELWDDPQFWRCLRESVDEGRREGKREGKENEDERRDENGGGESAVAD